MLALGASGAAFSCTHDSCGESVPSVRTEFQDVRVDALPWGFGRLLRGEVSAAARVDDLPDEARAERELMRATGIKSFLTIALVVRDRVLGGMGFDWLAREEPFVPETLAALRVVGGIIAATLLRADAERERTRLEARLRQVERLESLGLLAAGVAHDFNNLLVAIINYIDLARQDRPSPDLDEARAAADRAAVLTRQLLAFGRQSSGDRKLVDLNALVEGLMSMLRRVCPSSVELDFIPGHELGMVAADPGQIEQVLSNLCLNGAAAIQGSGRVIIETENVLLNGNYVRANPWARPGRYVLLSVSDTGCGMSADVKERIFEPFFTTKPASSGSGLGLSVVYGIVRQLNGLIHVYSELDRGSTFKVYLPVSERLAGQVGPKIADRVVGGVETILVAEDHEMVARVARRILEEAGYRVILATSGPEAMRVYDLHRGAIDLALLDAIMPGALGREVAAHIERTRPEIPVVFASGYAADMLDSGFLRAKGASLLEKPYDADRLLTRVREALDRSRGRDRGPTQD